MLRVPADHKEFARSRARPYGQHVLLGDPVSNHLQQHFRLHYQGKPYTDDTRRNRADANRSAIARVNQQLRMECFSFVHSPIADRQRCDILHVRERSGTLLQVHERGRHQTFLPGPPEMRRVHAQAQLREGSRSRFKWT